MANQPHRRRSPACATPGGIDRDRHRRRDRDRARGDDRDHFRRLAPFIAVDIVRLALLVFVPAIALALPSLMR